MRVGMRGQQGTEVIMADDPPIWTGVREPMKHSDSFIGCEFLTPTGRWRCTDVGTRTVAAIRLDLDHDPSWYNGPPYGIVEHVFDEDAIEGCEPAPEERTYDDSGRGRIMTVSRPRA
jgi:hypothetical protein